MNLGVVFLSGGLDSTTVAAFAKNRGYELTGITLNYGQTHLKEIDAAGEVARHLGLKHRVVDVEFFKDLAWYVGNQQKWDTFIKARSGGNGGVLGLPEQFVVAFALG